MSPSECGGHPACGALGLLLVDDDQAFVEVLAGAMRRRGYAVEVALDAEQALAHTRRDPVKFAVVDLRLGEASGLDLVVELLRVRTDMRIVILTGYASIATAVEAIKLGAWHYLTKPVEAEDIVAALHRDEPDTAVPVPEAPMSVDRLSWEHIQRVLNEAGGNITEAARRLNMHRRTLQRKLQKRPPSR